MLFLSTFGGGGSDRARGGRGGGLGGGREGGGRNGFEGALLVASSIVCLVSLLCVFVFKKITNFYRKNTYEERSDKEN